MIESSYARVSARLLREWRVVTLSNAVAFALLADVAFNRARVVNGMLQAVGATAPAC